MRIVRAALRNAERFLSELEPTLTREQRERFGVRLPAILKQIAEARIRVNGCESH